MPRVWITWSRSQRCSRQRRTFRSVSNRMVIVQPLAYDLACFNEPVVDKFSQIGLFKLWCRIEQAFTHRFETLETRIGRTRNRLVVLSVTALQNAIFRAHVLTEHTERCAAVFFVNFCAVGQRRHVSARDFRLALHK